MKNKDKKSSLVQWISIAVIVVSFLVSGVFLYIKNASNLPNEVSDNTDNGVKINDSSKISLDNDPVLGDLNAPLTIIEFSDYECPFCKRSFEQLLPELKSNYINDGKLKLVYRDFPLSFHPNAHKYAEAAECARDQGDDKTYFKFHDQMFSDAALSQDKLPIIAKNLALDVNQFKQCLDSGKFVTEVDKDIADGTSYGVSGTPSWFVGKSNSDGTIEGTIIVGAQPFSVFKTAIDKLLK